MQIGFLGLGKMGSRMVKRLAAKNHDVIAWNRSKDAVEELVESLTPDELQNFSPADDIQSLMSTLEKPRVIWMMLPAGKPTQDVFEEILKFAEKGDIVIDGGNAHFSDTQRRFEVSNEKGIRYLGIGVSGGILAQENGYPMMVGGDKTAYEYITPILETFSKPYGGYAYFGTGGAGHFVKMAHNGIEYGMMQAIGEGFGVMEKSPYNLDLLKVAQIFQKNTIVAGFLIDRAADALSKNEKLSDITGVLEENGEARWTVEEAKKENVPVQVIEESLKFRLDSQKDENIQKSFAARMVAALRREFGGHKVVKK